jgi:hypothetical protein
MIKLIISVNVLFFSVWTFFTSPDAKKATPISEIPICNAKPEGGINPGSGKAFFPQFQPVQAVTSAFETDVTLAYSMPLPPPQYFNQLRNFKLK